MSGKPDIRKDQSREIFISKKCVSVPARDVAPWLAAGEIALLWDVAFYNIHVKWSIVTTHGEWVHIYHFYPPKKLAERWRTLYLRMRGTATAAIPCIAHFHSE